MRLKLWLAHSTSMTGINWDTLERLGITRGKKILPGMEGDYIINDYTVVVTPPARQAGSRKHRIFVHCSCDNFVELGHYGQHIGSKKHARLP